MVHVVAHGVDVPDPSEVIHLFVWELTSRPHLHHVAVESVSFTRSATLFYSRRCCEAERESLLKGEEKLTSRVKCSAPLNHALCFVACSYVSGNEVIKCQSDDSLEHKLRCNYSIILT